VSEGLQPIFGCFWVDVAEPIRKRRGSSWYVPEDTFDSGPIAMGISAVEAVAIQRCRKPFCIIDQKDGGSGTVFLPKLTEKFARLVFHA